MCIFHFRLLKLQLNPLKVKQQYKIFKLVSLYTRPVKIGSKNVEHNIFTVNDLIAKTKNQQHSQWSLSFGESILFMGFYCIYGIRYC